MDECSELQALGRNTSTKTNAELNDFQLVQAMSCPVRPSSQADLPGGHSRDLVCSWGAKDSVRSGRRPRRATRDTYGSVRRLVVDVDEGTLDAWERLYFVLQLLGEVVRLPQGRVRVHDDVELDEVVLFPSPFS